MAYFISNFNRRIVAVIGTSRTNGDVKHGFTGYCDGDCGATSQISSPEYGQKWTCSKAGRYRITFTQENNGKANKWYGRISSGGSLVVNIAKTEKNSNQYHGIINGPYEYDLSVGDYSLVALAHATDGGTSAVVAVIEEV